MILIILTFHGYEKYCNAFLEYLKYTWPNHPEIWFLTDGKTIGYPNVISIDSDQWLIVLHEGLKQIKNIYPQLDYAYLVLEDLIPLVKVSNSHLAKVESIITKHQLDCVSFVVYDHKYLGNDMMEIDGISFYRLPPDFPFYSQLQPAIWKVEYLQEICQHAYEQKTLDPWSFEKIFLGKQHYVSEYSWPSVMHGFLHAKHPVWEAIWKIKTPEGTKFRNNLIREYISWGFNRTLEKISEKKILKLSSKEYIGK